ncbi:MAG: helix-turn-helix domain-containing protein [Clostridiales bacterium]|nr:helix-turn-helix domain-containing protein [Clostridiales bacterium]
MENTFGEFLKQKRLEKSLTQKQIAEILFVSESAVSKWEKNIAHPDITLLPKLSELLGVTEHELITASIDKQTREDKVQAKKWRVFSMSWSLFFYISYTVALIPCFICNLAINKTLSWFWIVLSALILSFTFTNLPKLIKKYKLLLIPLSMYLALCLLLGVCCIYTKGTWFWIASISVLLFLFIIFLPIYIAKYKVFSKIKKYNDFVSVFIDFIVLHILLIVIHSFTQANGFSHSNWYLKIALPIVVGAYLLLNLFLGVRFLKINRLIKTSLILFVFVIMYLVIPFLKVSNTYVQTELDDLNIFKANFSSWVPGVSIEQNIHFIICLSLLAISLGFLISGLIIHFKRKKQSR